MSTSKIIFTAILLVLALLGAFMLFGLVFAVAKFLFFLGVLVLIGVGAVKLLGRRQRPELEARGSQQELEEAQRVIEEIKRKQLSGK
jgi:uncharacterized membrane protein